MHPRLVLFDIDGTLIDTDGAGRLAMERASRSVLGVDRIDTRTAGVRFAGMTDPVILEAVARAVGLDAAQYTAARDELQRVFLRELEVEMARPGPPGRVLPGVRELLDDLRARERVYLGLVTGNFERGARLKLEPYGLNPYFPAGGFASDSADRREIARVAWRKLSDLTGERFAPGQITVVGDTGHDIDCAAANGFRSVAVDSGWVPRDELEQAGPDVLLRDMSDLDATLAALELDPARE